MSDTDLWAYESLLSIQDVTDAKPRIPYNEWYCLYALPVHGRPIAQVKHYFFIICCVLLCSCQSRLAEGIIFSNGPFVRPTVRFIF